MAPNDGVLDYFLPTEADKPYFVWDQAHSLHWVSVLSNLAVGNFNTLSGLDSQAYSRQFYRWALLDAFGQASGMIRQPDGGITFTITGLEGRVFTIEGSIDLAHWQDIGTAVVTGGTAQFTDLNAGSFRQRFYRLKSAR
jgi:hypothetical protein